MKFSIIIPCYNSSSYFDKLFSSLLDQTYDHDNFEVVFINDGSTDDTLKQLEERSKALKHAKVITQVNAGVSAARNYGIRNASGEWLLFLDADDWISEGYLAELANAINCFPNLGIFFTRFANAYQGSKKVKTIRGSVPTEILAKNVDGYLLFDLEAINSLNRAASAMIFKREIILNAKLTFDEVIEYGEDFIFHFSYLEALKKLATNSDLLYQSCYLPKETYFYYKVRDERSRSHDKFQNDLVLAETIKLEKAYELLVNSNYDANQLAFQFKHIGVSVVYALSFSKNLKAPDCPQVKEELVRYLQALKKWLLLIRDLGLTQRFISVIAKEKFFVMTRSIPYALFLCSLACNPVKFSTVIDFVEGVKIEEEKNEDSDSSAEKEGNKKAGSSDSLVVSVAKSIKVSILKLFGRKKRKALTSGTIIKDSVKETISSTLHLDQENNTASSKIANGTNGLNNTPNTNGKEDENSAFNPDEVSQFTKLKMNHAAEVDFLYFRQVYFGKKKHLQIVTNCNQRLKNILESFNFNPRKLTRNVAFRVCGLTLGQAITINLQLLEKKDLKALEEFCETIRSNNLFDYQRGGVFNFFSYLFTGAVKNKNYILYRDPEEKALLEEVAKYLGKEGGEATIKMANSYLLGYPTNDRFIAAEEIYPFLAQHVKAQGSNLDLSCLGEKRLEKEGDSQTGNHISGDAQETILLKEEASSAVINSLTAQTSQADSVKADKVNKVDKVDNFDKVAPTLNAEKTAKERKETIEDEAIINASQNHPQVKITNIREETTTEAATTGTSPTEISPQTLSPSEFSSEASNKASSMIVDDLSAVNLESTSVGSQAKVEATNSQETNKEANKEIEEVNKDREREERSLNTQANSKEEEVKAQYQAQPKLPTPTANQTSFSPQKDRKIAQGKEERANSSVGKDGRTATFTSSLDLDSSEQAFSPEQEETSFFANDCSSKEVIRLSSIFASYHVRGLAPEDYSQKFTALDLNKLLAKKSGIKGLVKYYMDFGCANSYMLTLSQLANRQDCGFNIFTRDFPFYDFLVVVDCEVSDFMLANLRSYPNFRLVFPDLALYCQWLERLVKSTASPAELARGELNPQLYHKDFDLWQALIRSFVLVKDSYR